MSSSPAKWAVAPDESSQVGAAGENLTRGLRALGHPLTLICVATLLLNDHILKPLYPSDLTGKLSDFAGLFFFPYLLIAFQAALASALSHLVSMGREPRPRVANRQPFIVYSAYVVTGLLFSISKVSPGFNAALNHLLIRLGGLPVHVALDPADLFALVALVPSLSLLLKVEPRRRGAACIQGYFVCRDPCRCAGMGPPWTVGTGHDPRIQRGP